jgi:hypothetical protein
MHFGFNTRLLPDVKKVFMAFEVYPFNARHTRFPDYRYKFIDQFIPCGKRPRFYHAFFLFQFIGLDLHIPYCRNYFKNNL